MLFPDITVVSKTCPAALLILTLEDCRNPVTYNVSLTGLGYTEKVEAGETTIIFATCVAAGDSNIARESVCTRQDDI